MFGQQQKAFGGFGAQPASSNMFAAPATTSSTGFGFKPSGGLFGSTPTATSSGFGAGGTGLFGATSTSTGTGLFGNTTTTSQPASGTGLFGQTSGASFLKPATTNAFAPTTGFGGGTGLFSAPTTQAQQASGGLFGATSSTSGGLFGGTSGFGSTMASAGTGGTKFAATDGTDNMVKNGVSIQVKTKHYCICGMKQYEQKSMEELRFEDYAAGLKGPKAGTAAGSSLFGSSTAQPAAASTGFGGFGAAASSTPSFGFGTTTTQASTGFGAKPAGGGLFGSTPVTGSIFGQSSTTTPAFGAATTSAGGGLFGSAAKPSPFGTTTNFGTSSGFGQTSSATTGFGGFGAKPATGFGAATSLSTGFGFGSQPAASTGFGAFGAKTTPAFGAQPTASTTGFGGFGGFGQTASSTGFGMNKPTTGFGTNTNFGTTSFGGSLANPIPQQQQPVQLASNLDLQAQQELMQQQIFALSNSPYGDSSLFRNIKKESKSKQDIIPTDPVTQQAVLSSSGSKLKVNARPSAKVKLTNTPSVQAIGTSPLCKGDLFSGIEEDSYSTDRLGKRRSVKKLVLRPSNGVGGASSLQTTSEQQRSAFSSPSIYSASVRADTTHTPLAPDDSFNLSGAKVERKPINRLYPSLEMNDTVDELHGGAQRGRPSPDRKPVVIDATYTAIHSPDATVIGQGTPTIAVPQTSQGRLSISKRESVDIVAEMAVTPGEDQVSVHDPEAEPHPCGVVCTRADYYTIPSLKELGNYLDANGDCFVENLSIGREGYGSVFFPGTTNVANLDIDSIVHFRRKEITVYPDDDNKPIEGQGLNKPAEVTLDYVWPNDKTTRSPIKSPERLKDMNYQEKIELATSRIGAKFIDYRPDTGSWVFQVKHFSKYGLLDDDSDDDNTAAKPPAASSKLKTLQLQSLNLQKMPISQVKTGQQEKLASGDSTKVVNDSSLLAPVNTSNYLGDRESDEERENIRPREAFSKHPFHSEHSEISDTDSERAEVMLLPMSHQLAAQCGVDSTNVQRMKASFLDDDDEDMTVLSRRHSAIAPDRALFKQRHTIDPSSPMPQSPFIRTSVKSELDLTPKISSSFFDMTAKSEYKMEVEERSFLKLSRVSDIQLPEPDYPPLPSGAQKPLVPKCKIQGYRLQLKQVPLEKSLVNGRHKTGLLDVQCTAGRRSRVGWTKAMVMAHNGGSSVFAHEKSQVQSNKFSILSPGVGRYHSPYQVTVESANLGTQAQQMDPLVLETRVKALRIQLRHMTHTGTSASPCLEPAPGIAALHEYGEESLNDLDAAAHSDGKVAASFRHQILIWELVVALWGSLPEFEQMDEIDKSSYLYQSARNDSFSRWLSYAANYHVQKETTPKAQMRNGVPSAIFSHLTARQIPSAARLAVESKDLRLALLLSQASTSQMVKNLVHKQLSDWNTSGADKYISPDRLKLYVLLAGCMVWEGSSCLVNCCTDLDWKRSLALHYWYSQSKLSIPSAVARYDAAWNEEAYAVPPRPLYMEEAGEDDSQSKDTCYHLLKLYCNSSYSLNQLLLSASYTSDPLDYHMSWHLMQVLSALGYTHLDEWQATAIHTRYSEQLESCGLWEWAVVPLLNLSNKHFREKTIKELLLRHICLDPSDATGSDSESMSLSEDADSPSSDYARREKFLLDELNIPSRWLSEAKAIKARCEGLVEEETTHLLQCGQYNSAHKLLLNKVAPELIVRDNLNELHSYLDQMQTGSNSISEWAIGGKIYLDYVTMHDVMEELKMAAEDSTCGYSIEKVRPELLSLARRLLSLTTPTPLHLLAQSMMALHTAENIKYIMSMDEDRLIPDTAIVSSRHLAESLSILPLQSDHAVHLLRETLSSFMLEY
ncbi:nuclear pore complex protein Nup98-Nup96-like isoform X3 [Watersipora subatra]|uniref:nuclear pore complex protein Nup98-Nup96-like isoform X3 n=1 Tax=Watersipora subatra TaxID=2589382 RepID=UPI00355C9727